MTKEQIINSTILKKRFIRDCGLPITVYDNPYFIQRLGTINSLFDCVSKFERFCKELEAFNSEQSYLEWYNAIKDKIIDAIKNHPKYQEFNELTISKTIKEVGKNNLYIEPNDRLSFISIDMKKANFSSMRFFAPEIFGGCETWEEYVGRFTDSKHFTDSKYIRQVIFGACNPKRQIKYESYLMEQVYNGIKKVFPQIEVFSLGEDEIIIPLVQHGSEIYSISSIKNAIPDELRSIVRVDVFVLKKIGNYGWLKTYPFVKPTKIEFKCVDAEIFHQIVKQYHCVQITEDDLVFYHNGQLARFLKEISNPW